MAYHFPELQFNAPKINTPFENALPIAQLQQAQNQNKLAQMQFQKAERDEVKENKLAGAYSDYYAQPNQDQNMLYKALAGAGQGAAIPDAMKSMNDAAASGVELGNKRLTGQKLQGEITQAQKERSAAELGSLINDPNLSVDKVYSVIQSSDDLNPQQKQQLTDAVSQQDPAQLKPFLNQILMGVMKPKDQVDLGLKERDFRQKAANEAFNADGTPNAAFQNYSINKATAGATQNYGSPVAGVGPDGKQVFFQPSKGGGAPSIVPGVTPTPKDKSENITEGERKAATLLRRLDFSEKQLQAALKDNSKAEKPGLLQNGLRAIGAEAAANTLTGSERQRVESAQLDILDAALTLGTGAAYTKEQLMGYRQSYFPQLGDGPGQIKDKAARLKNIIEAAKIAAGRAAPIGPQSTSAKRGVLSPAEILNTELQDALQSGNTQNVDALRREMKARKIQVTAGTTGSKPAGGIKFLGFE